MAREFHPTTSIPALYAITRQKNALVALVFSMIPLCMLLPVRRML
jgi:hypothetical protein